MSTKAHTELKKKGGSSQTALLLIDVINHFQFPDGNHLLRNALTIVPNLVKLKHRATRAGIPSIYVNDNFGDWHSDPKKLVEYCVRNGARSKAFVEALRPNSDDYIILKPMHSAFYQTPLIVLLQTLGTKSIILCGLATNSCILCTAHDANMREYRLIVASDCTAARSLAIHNKALQLIREITDASVLRSTSIRFDKL